MNDAKYTDMTNAALFASMHRDRLRYVRDRRAWCFWQDGRWRRDLTGEAERAAKATARTIWERAFGDEEATKWAIKSQSEPRLRAMLELASTEPGIAQIAADFDRNPLLLACPNGTVDLRTGLLRPHDTADLISLGTDVVYDPDAACGRWERFLHEVFDGNVDLIGYVQRAIGYMLTGETREHVVFIFHGAGCNGKSTLIEIVKLVLGSFADTAPFETFTRARADGGARNDIARLHRSRLVIGSESAAGHRLDEATVKHLSGGDTVAARFLYGEFFEFKPQFKIVLVSNHKPHVDGNDDAIWRRICLVPFEVSFEGREDRQLRATLEAELSGILAWAVRGCLYWQREGLGQADAITEASREYRRDEDALGAFLEERCALVGSVATSELREAYERFSAEVGVKPLAANALGRELRKRGIKPVSGRTRRYLGLSLRGLAVDDGFAVDDGNEAVSVTPLGRAGEGEIPENTVIIRHPSSLADVGRATVGNEPDLDYYIAKHPDISIPGAVEEQ